MNNDDYSNLISSNIGGEDASCKLVSVLMKMHNKKTLSWDKGIFYRLPGLRTHPGMLNLTWDDMAREIRNNYDHSSIYSMV